MSVVLHRFCTIYGRILYVRSALLRMTFDAGAAFFRSPFNTGACMPRGVAYALREGLDLFLRSLQKILSLSPGSILGL